jgi:2-dehydro-3-deoxygalactonokinase
MMHVEAKGDEVCAIYVDMGTTNTSGWLMRGSKIISRASKSAGVRDTAREGSPAKIKTALKELIAELRMSTGDASSSGVPVCVAASGMISSPLGLVEISHVQAPASLAELATSSRWVDFPEVAALPILLVPGVRSGPRQARIDLIHDTDVMRGEETLCVGLLALGLAKPPAVVLNLGSHWKAIQLGGQGQIGSSVTSLSGELIHAAQTQTILASAVVNKRARTIDEHWMEAGMKEQRRSGLPRALFCARLLELANEGSPEDRLSFLIGAFIAADLDALISRGVLAHDSQVAVVGAAALAEAWRCALTRMSISAIVLTAAESEQALLTGLRCILMHAWQRRVAGNATK